MLLDLIKTAWKPLILIALVSLTITWAFNIENVLITEKTINGITIKIFNMQTYLENISNAWTSNALNFDTILPTRTWQDPQGNWLEQQFWNAIVNNMAYLLDWVYFPINFILWIGRWMCWLLKILLAVIGWNTQQINGVYASQLVRILSWIIEELMIPYA